MVNMKKIIGILLALCFVLSVTAASAAASGDDDHHEKPHEKPRFDDRHDKKDRHDERYKFNDQHKKRHHHPAHWEKKRVGHREFRNNHWQTVFVYKWFYVAEFYDYHFY
jgi:Ni/Co efflux regulator RcnB